MTDVGSVARYFLLRELNRMADLIRSERLIQEVKKYPVLYDFTNDQYRNTDYKERIWKEITTELNAEGQEEECKRKWNSIRDSLRRSIQKRKKPGRAASSIYKYETILDFLIPHLDRRKELSNAPHEEHDSDDSPETGNKLQKQDSIQDTKQPPDVRKANEPEKSTESLLSSVATTLANQVSAEKMPFHAGQKRKILNTEAKCVESPSSQLMAFILAEKQAEKQAEKRAKLPQSQNSDHIDVFLAAIATSLKSLDRVRLLAAKAKIFNIVNEYELEQVTANCQQRTATTNVYSSTSSDEHF